MTNWNPFDHHRGPFRLQVLRTRKVSEGSKRYPATTQTLPGLTDGADVADEAKALLTDPRDTIDAVYVFSETEAQHVMTYRRQA